MRSYARIFAFSLIIVITTKDVLAQTSCTVKSPSPTKAICNQRGNWTENPSEYQPIKQIVPNIETCQKFLLAMKSKIDFHDYYDRNGYYIFGFNTSSNLCTIYSSAGERIVPDMFTANASSDAIFYSQFCFDCSSRCPAQPDINFVDNPGFDLSANYIGPWTGSGPENGSPGDHSPHAILVGGTSYEQDFGQTITLCRNQSYMYSFDVKSVRFDPQVLDAATSRVDFSVGEVGIDRFWELDEGIQNNGWQKVQGSFRVEDHGDSHLQEEVGIGFFSYYTEVNFYIDNVAVTVLPDTLATTGPNLIANPGFESGDIAPWIYQSFFSQGKKGRPVNVKNSIISPGISGNYKLQSVFHKSDFSKYFSAFSELLQEFKVTPYTTYVLSFDYFVRHPGMTLSINVGKVYHNITQYGFNPETNKITTFQFVYQSTNETKHKLSISGSTGSETKYHGRNVLLLDNFSVRELVQ